MRIHCLQHVPFEGPAGIDDWAARKGYPVTTTLLFEHGKLPDREAFDWLVVMGGPMGVRDETDYPWMANEKALIGAAIAAGKTVIGVCLSAQLIAAALGARVYPNAHREIGWFPVALTDQGRASDLFAFLPHRFEVFHWHGDIFGLPDGAVHLAHSEGCEHQVFTLCGPGAGTPVSSGIDAYKGGGSGRQLRGRDRPRKVCAERGTNARDDGRGLCTYQPSSVRYP